MNQLRKLKFTEANENSENFVNVPLNLGLNLE